MAHPMRRQSAQVLVFFALVLPLVLLPVAAYAVDAAVATAAYSGLLEVTSVAAEDAAQQIDVTALRSTGTIAVDGAAATAIAGADVATMPGAKLAGVTIGPDWVTVTASEDVRLPLDFVGRGGEMLRATATARIAPGYDSPSSLLPLPVSTF